MPNGNYSFYLCYPQLFYVAVLFLLGIIVFPVVLLFGDKILNFIYKYRYFISAVILFICVLFEISGSSIAAWKYYMPGTDDTLKNGVIFGVERPVRTDEWAVNTPMAFSQYLNYTGAYPYFGETVRGTTTDMFIVYGQPVWDIAVIFRPFHWGYLLFGPSRGLSFFWCARFLALVLVTFEFGMLITGKNKLLSATFAVLVSFAPFVQWWFAINGLVEMLVFGQLAILIIHYYMNTDHYSFRIFLSISLALCGGGFILLFYPAWQIPIAYIYLAMLIWVVIDNWKNFKFSAKKDIPIIALFFVFLAGGMAYVFSKSFDTVRTVMNTVYPGGNFQTGGHVFAELFRYPANLLFPLKMAILDTNVCEMASFFDLAPLGIILALIVVLKKKDTLLICLLSCAVFLDAYIIIGFPAVLSGLSLLSNCLSRRVVTVIGFLNLMLLVRALTLFDFKLKVSAKLIGSAAVALFIAHVNVKLYSGYFFRYTLVFSIVIGMAMFIASYMIFSSDNRKIMTIICLMCMIAVAASGFLVNPVQKGIEVITENEFINEIKEISSGNPGAKWIVDGEKFPTNGYPIMAGAPTINSTNVYPALERWKLVDESSVFDDAYNRYAHFDVEIVSDRDTLFELLSADLCLVYLNVRDLKKLEVTYIISANELEPMNNGEISFDCIYNLGSDKIYQVLYN